MPSKTGFENKSGPGIEWLIFEMGPTGVTRQGIKASGRVWGSDVDSHSSIHL